MMQLISIVLPTMDTDLMLIFLHNLLAKHCWALFDAWTCL